MNTLLIVIFSITNSGLKPSSPVARLRLYTPSWDDLQVDPAFFLFGELLAFSLHGSRECNMKNSCPYYELFAQWDTPRGDYGINSTIHAFIIRSRSKFWLTESTNVKDCKKLGSRTSFSSRSHCGIYNTQLEDPRLTLINSSEGEIVLGMIQGMSQSLGNILAECYRYIL